MGHRRITINGAVSDIEEITPQTTTADKNEIVDESIIGNFSII
jgi:hypothetical protein